MPPRLARRGEGVATISRLGQRVRAEAQPDTALGDLVDHRLIRPLVGVVHELGALVTEKTRVFETTVTGHGVKSSRVASRGE